MTDGPGLARIRGSILNPDHAATALPHRGSQPVDRGNNVTRGLRLSLGAGSHKIVLHVDDDQGGPGNGDGVPWMCLAAIGDSRRNQFIRNSVAGHRYLLWSHRESGRTFFQYDFTCTTRTKLRLVKFFHNRKKGGRSFGPILNGR